jgi:nicotinate-nucleotide--dimethylbenzimidazole phosphoribosyltransferase
VAALDLDAVAARVDPLDDEAMAAARQRSRGLGRLDELAVWLAGAQGAAPARDPQRARVVVFAADHGIAAAGVSASPIGETARRLARIGTGEATVSALARTAGATIRTVDVGVGRPSGRLDREDALSLAEAEAAVATGAAVADAEVDAGADLLIPGDLGVGGSTVAAVLVAALTDTEPVKVIGRGSGIDDRTWMRKVVAIRDGLRRARPFTVDPVALLAAVGGADVAATAGFLLQAAARRTPVLLDGVLSAAAGLVAAAVTPAAPPWWVAAHRSPEPAHALALDHLDLTPVLDLGITAGEGAGALTVLPLLRAAVLAASPDV